jgi:hypothetical protein
MFTNRVSNITIGVGLILATILALLAFNLSGFAKVSPLRSVGMGDLHLYEKEVTIPVIEASDNNRGLVGMGDLRIFETLASLPKTGAPDSSQLVGMGDLHIYEASVSLPNTGALQSSHRLVGMGDLHLYEARQ